MDADSLTRGSTHLELVVTRLGCAGGKTGTVLEPVVRYEAARVVVTTTVEALPENVGFTCPSNDGVRVGLDLDEPLGSRPLVDGTCLAGEAAANDPNDQAPSAAQTAPCVEGGGVRWRPPRS